jgi:hypothetical protein
MCAFSSSKLPSRHSRIPRYLKDSDALMVVSALPARVILDVGAGSPFVKLWAVVVHFSVLMWMLDHLLKSSVVGFCFLF